MSSIRRCISSRSEGAGVMRGTVPIGTHTGVGAMAEEIAIPDELPPGADVYGKRVVITGLSRGLGGLLAHACSRAGASVARVARTDAGLKTVTDDLPGPSMALSGDVTDEYFNECVA